MGITKAKLLEIREHSMQEMQPEQLCIHSLADVL